MIEEQQFVLFIAGVQHYFKQTCNEIVKVMPPYILDTEFSLMDYTGVIAISGNHIGRVYFTAEQPLLRCLLQSLGEPDANNPIMLSDIAGEVANQISGNFRSKLGQNFIISTPSVYNHRLNVNYDERRATYVVPLLWRGEKASLVVDFQR